MQTVTGTISIETIIARKLVTTRFHPMVSVRKRSVVGFEALSGGINPSSGKGIPPTELFSHAAREGRTLELDRLCRSLAIERFAAQSNLADGSLLSLNLDPSILAEATGSGHLINCVRSLGLNPSRIMIEILESSIGDAGALESFVRTYRNLGFLIAIDDMGTGFSNFERISLLKPDVLKLDRSMISRLASEYHMRAIVRSIVALSHRIGALVVAEGIETEEQALIALELGIDMLQGYYFCTPQDSIPLAMSMADEKLCSISRILKEQTIMKIDSRKKRHVRYGAIISDMIEALSAAHENDFDTVLAEGSETRRH
jgi:EAL domain-containing protein (putative c-di-GMP-specific phosphodiesterase class I)